MAVSISAMFKLVDQMSDRMEHIGSIGDKAMERIERSTNKADQAFSKSQSSANKLAAVYKNFEGNAEQLANAIQRGEKTLSDMEKTEGKTAASTFEYSTKVDKAAEAQENLMQAMNEANNAAKEYEEILNSNTATADELAAAEERLDNAARDLFAAFDKGADAAIDLEEATEKAAEKMKDYGEKTEESAKKSEDFGDKASKAIHSVESLLVAAGIAKLVKEITGALLDCAAAAETVETSAAKLETLAGFQNMEMLKDQIYTISAATGEAQEGLYEVAYNAISAGTDVKKAAEITEAATKLATAGFTTSSSALSVLTTATNSYGKAAGSATDITDGLITVQNLGVTTVAELANSMGKSISTAAAYNVSLNNLESAYISVTKAGINTQEGTTYINAMITELGKSSSDVAKILRDETGKSFGELMDAGYSLADVLGIIYDKAGKNSEAMMNLWGSQTAAVASAAIVNQGLDDFNDNLNTLQNSAGATSNAYSIMANTTEFAHNKMTNSANNLKISIGQALNPMLKNLYNTASSFFEKLAGFVKDHPGFVKAITAITVAIGAFVAAVAVAKVAVAAFTAVMDTNPIFLAISAIAALTAGIIALASSSDEASERLTASSKAQADELEKLNEQYEKYKGTAEETSPEANRLRGEIDELTKSFGNNKKTVRDVIDETDKHLQEAQEHVKKYEEAIQQIDNERLSAYALIQKLEDLIEVNDNTAASESRIKMVIEELNQLLPDLALNYEDVVHGASNYIDIMKRAADTKYNNDKQKAQLEAYTNALNDLQNAEKDYAENKANLDAYLAENEHGGWTYYPESPDPYRPDLGEGYYRKLDNDVYIPGRLGEDGYYIAYEQYDGLNYNEAGHRYAGDSTPGELADKMDAAQQEIERQKQIIRETEDAWAREAEAAEYAFNHPKDAAEAATNTIEKYKDEINDLCTAYGDAYNAALESFEGQFGLFDEVITKSEEGAETLTTFEKSTVESAQKALDSQLEYWTTYNENISKLKNLSKEDLGLTQAQYDDFMAYVQNGSEEAAGLAASMVNNIKNGNKDAVEKLAQTFSAVQDQQKNAADAIADWQTDFYKKLDDLQARMEKAVDDMELDDEAATAAKNMIDAYANSIRGGLGNAVSAANEVATAVKNALSVGDLAMNMVKSTFNIGGYAEGTDYATRGVHLVGEYGPELVLFNGGEQVVPSYETQAILNRSANDLSEHVPDSVMTVPSMTYSDSEGSREQKKTIDININGQGSFTVDGSVAKEDLIELLYEHVKPAFVAALADEIAEEGDDSYDY